MEPQPGFAVVENKSCILCGNAALREVFNGVDDRYGYPGTFEVVQCETCGHAFLKKMIARSDIGRLYEQFYCHQEPSQQTHARLRHRDEFIQKLAKLSLLSLF